MAITFKKCELGDLEALKRISVTTFKAAFESKNDPEDFKKYLSGAFSKKQLKSELTHPHASFYFAFQEERHVGYLKINIGNAQSEFQEAEGMELERIYVKSPHQGQSIGQQLLSFAETKALEEGKTYLWLGVWEKNIRAIQFYERHGYLKFGEHPYYIGTDKQTDWLLKKKLK